MAGGSALATVLLYLLEGALGLPVFQGTPAAGIGLAYMLGPTGGYLVGFACRGRAGRLAGGARLRPQSAEALRRDAAGDAIVFALGLAWLGTVHRLGQAGARRSAFYPFMLGDLVKLALAACLVSAGARLVRR